MVCYAVVRFGAEWGVLSERRRIGRFTAQDSALQLGIMLAFEALAAGNTAELLVQDLGGQLEPYPLPAAHPPPAAIPICPTRVATGQTLRMVASPSR